VKDMIFTARLIEAKEALQMGLLTEVVKNRAALDERASDLAKQIASFAPLTLHATKEAFHRMHTRDSQEQDQDLILMCYMSDDFREGMAAFLEKRAPQWKGR